MNKETANLLSQFDSNITELYLHDKKINGILDLSRFTQLEKLNCVKNIITKIINIPETLKEFDCERNIITFLDNLPQNLNILNCSCNELTLLDNLPSNLTSLNCSFNIGIKSLDYLPSNLLSLKCIHCDLKNISCLPANLKKLKCGYNQNLILDGLPQFLEYLSYDKIPIYAPENCFIWLSWIQGEPINEKELKEKYKNLKINYLPSLH